MLAAAGGLELGEHKVPSEPKPPGRCQPGSGSKPMLTCTTAMPTLEPPSSGLKAGMEQLLATSLPSGAPEQGALFLPPGEATWDGRQRDGQQHPAQHSRRPQLLWLTPAAFLPRPRAQSLCPPASLHFPMAQDWLS